MERIDVDCLVIGAGVVGLAIARHFAMSGREVFVVEKTSDIGSQTSSRNSEVIHAGIYYPKSSLKAKLCVRGKELLYKYCDENHIAYRMCGKLIVAVNDIQVSQLIDIRAHGYANGVNDIEYLNQAAVQSLEPELNSRCALLSPSTGILDSHAYMLQLQADLEAHGGSCVFNSKLKLLSADDEGVELTLNGDEARVRARTCINSAGLSAVSLVEQSELISRDLLPNPYFAKGSYFSYAGNVPFSRLVYPVPEPGGLGVHLTLDLQGGAKFGPDVEWLNTKDIAEFEYLVDPEKRDRFYSAASQYWPSIEKARMQPNYSGIRPKISGPGEAAADFMIQGESVHGIKGLVNLFGIESPGLTSSMAIAEHVFDYLSA